MNKLYSSKTFQFFAIVIMSGLCLLLDTLTQINFNRIELPKNRPEYNGSGANGSVYDKTGRRLYNLTSDLVWQYPDNDKIFAKGLHISMYNESDNSLKYELYSDDGWVQHNKKIGFLGSHAHLIDYQDHKNGPIDIYASSVNLDFNKNILTSNDDMKATQNNNVIMGHGFTYEHDRQFLVIKSKVKVIYYAKQS